VTRSQRRARRRARRRALGVVGAAAAVATGSIGLLTTAAAGDASSKERRPRPAPVIVEPALITASQAVQERREGQLALAVMARAAAEKAERDSIWDRIAACETQGDWSMQGSAFSGGLGFANSAWSAFGGHEFAPNAGRATREQQIIVAERIRAAVGLGAWGCAKRL
jgi:Transglycosylase-like domain